MEHKLEIAENKQNYSRTLTFPPHNIQENEYLSTLSLFEPSRDSSCFQESYSSKALEKEYFEKHESSNERRKDIRVGFLLLLRNLFSIITPYMYGYLQNSSIDIMIEFYIY